MRRIDICGVRRVGEAEAAFTEDGIDLKGQRILVVEGDLAIGAALCSELKRYGATVLGPAPTSHYAYLLLMGRRGVDSAILHIDAARLELYDLAESLRQRGVPMIFATDGDGTPPGGAFGDAPCLTEPLDALVLAKALNRLMRSAPAAMVEAPPVIPERSMAERLDRAIARALREFSPTGAAGGSPRRPLSARNRRSAG
jgi:DNA-binding response OmpR family regulator